MEPRDLLANVYRPLLDRAGLPRSPSMRFGTHYSHMTPRLMSNAAVVMDRLLDEDA
jgi:hypothetical protein